MATPKWQCIKCGNVIPSTATPYQRATGPCSVTPSGNHVWVKIQ